MLRHRQLQELLFSHIYSCTLRCCEKLTSGVFLFALRAIDGLKMQIAKKNLATGAKQVLIIGMVSCRLQLLVETLCFFDTNVFISLVQIGKHKHVDLIILAKLSCASISNSKLVTA